MSCGKSDKKTTDCCNDDGQKIHFFNAPATTTWDATGATGAETTIYDKTVCITGNGNVLVDAVIAAEIERGGTGGTTYNTYKLYVNNVRVGQAGYKVDLGNIDSGLETSSLMWGGKLCQDDNVKVKVTAQLVAAIGTPSSNISNAAGLLTNPGPKGAFLRITIL